jgi:hypothetical protein
VVVISSYSDRMTMGWISESQTLPAVMLMSMCPLLSESGASMIFPEHLPLTEKRPQGLRELARGRRPRI